MELSVWCLEERNPLNTDQIVGLQDFEVNVDENILYLVYSIGLKIRGVFPAVVQTLQLLICASALLEVR